MSEGDTEKLKNAKNKITHSFFGLGLLAASFALIFFLRLIFGFDLLKLVWPSAYTSTPQATNLPLVEPGGNGSTNQQSWEAAPATGRSGQDTLRKSGQDTIEP